MRQYSHSWPVLHPVLQLSWFKSINNDAYEHAKEVLEYHYSKYTKTMPTLAAPPPPNVSSSTLDNSFLASIACCPITSTSTAAAQCRYVSCGCDGETLRSNPWHLGCQGILWLGWIKGIEVPIQWVSVVAKVLGKLHVKLTCIRLW